ncbi:MAG: ferric reductase-like transmembrane domain-containing protein [Ilumatobacteraceae bacterium]
MGPLPALAPIVARRLLGTRADWRMRRPAPPGRPVVGRPLVGPVLLIAAAGAGWFAFDDTVGEESTAALALLVGSVSILLMAWSNVLATRWRPLEPWFGGLDRMYRWHRWFGAVSVGAMWLHVQIVDDVKGIPGASRDVAHTAEDLAGTAETMLYVLVAVSLLRWVPYRWWRLTHKALVVPYALACWHFYTATKPYGNGSPWGRWFSALMVLGLVAWLYRVVWCDVVRRGVPYRVAAIDQVGSTTTIDLEPAGARHLRHRPGQFAFLKPQVRGMSEPHPFTIASGPDDDLLRFHVRDLGDWSQRLPERVRVGDRVLVEGPYGRLEPAPSSLDGHPPKGPVVWIAGGVGITPFLGALSSPERTGDRAPHLFHAVRTRDDAPALDDVLAAAADGRIVHHLHVSGEGTRLGRSDLEAVFGSGGLRDAHVVMCGPDRLVRDMTAAVRSLGAHHVHVEAFDIRTGVGPDLSRELADQASRRRSTSTPAPSSPSAHAAK